MVPCHSKSSRNSLLRPYSLRFLAGLVLALTSGLFVGGCKQQRPAPPTPPPPVVTVAQPLVYPVQRYYEYNGYLDAVETVQVTARVKGFLKEVKFTEGSEVKEGDLLFRIDPREYQATV